ncbi:mediator complex subunit [Saccharomycopsis crataegensis]|uniref:Mediator of RNA polymerase II transcription subunit 10 n=1 Tax=Saccharomycopsis crataegensis TaxID=43959 RepID=A0AAV5QK24_9ASCO|nr:mediator complex subunit [Saccharomycopsis crataegensis]
MTTEPKTAAEATDLSKEVIAALDQTGQQISQIVESFIELGVLVHDFQAAETSTESLAYRLNQTVEQLQSLTNSHKAELSQIPIPMDVLHYIEDGRNPNVYTREFVESTKKSNQHLRGKSIAFKQLRDILGNKIAVEFPELTDTIEHVYKRTD